MAKTSQNSTNKAPQGQVSMRQQIIDAGTELFAAHGFDGTSLQDIADAVGVKKPSLLHHFESKEALYQSVLDNLLARWKDSLPSLLLAANTGQGRFEAVWAPFIGFFAEEPSRARLLIREALDRPDNMKKMLRDHVRPWLPLLTKFLIKGKEEGVLHAEMDEDAMVVVLVHLVLGGAAVSDVLGALLPEGVSRSRAHRRQLDEITRAARCALFVTKSLRQFTAAWLFNQRDRHGQFLQRQPRPAILRRPVDRLGFSCSSHRA